jgi:hypothetical protein
MTTASFSTLALLVIGAGLPAFSQARTELSYEFFRDNVQPVFLKKRPGLARCITCHTHRIPPLEKPDAATGRWTEEQSRKNFIAWRQFVVPGQPMKSRVVLHPLAKEAGGDHFHAGGKHFKSQDDPEWRTLYDWVMGKGVSK